jgi:ADP-ribose pyrophosphatase
MEKSNPPKKLFPKVAAAAVVIRKGKILLVKRANEPSRGMWAVPGGSVQPGETLQAAAERETLEETGLVVTAKEPIHVFDLIEREGGGRLRFHFVIIDLAARFIDGRPRAGDDALEARWLSPEDLLGMPVTPGTRKLLEKIGFVKPYKAKIPGHVTNSGNK